MKQLKRQAQDATGADEQELQSKIHIAEVDLTYTRAFPYLEPYVSLYPRDAKGAISALDLERPAVWKEVEAAMAEGDAALEQLRERNPEGGVVPRKLRDGGKAEDEPPFQAKAKKEKNKKEKRERQEKKAKYAGAREPEGMDVDGDGSGSDDGGFFEE